MSQAKFSEYYKNAMKKIVHHLDKKQMLAFRVDKITRNGCIITVGVSDGIDFILEFGTIEIYEGQLVNVSCDNIYIDMTKMIRMEYNTEPTTGKEFLFDLIEAEIRASKP